MFFFVLTMHEHLVKLYKHYSTTIMKMTSMTTQKLKQKCEHHFRASVSILVLEAGKNAIQNVNSKHTD